MTSEHLQLHILLGEIFVQEDVVGNSKAMNVPSVGTVRSWPPLVQTSPHRELIDLDWALPKPERTADVNHGNLDVRIAWAEASTLRAFDLACDSINVDPRQVWVAMMRFIHDERRMDEAKHLSGVAILVCCERPVFERTLALRRP